MKTTTSIGFIIDIPIAYSLGCYSEDSNKKCFRRQKIEQEELN